MINECNQWISDKRLHHMWVGENFVFLHLEILFCLHVKFYEVLQALAINDLTKIKNKKFIPLEITILHIIVHEYYINFFKRWMAFVF